MTFNVYFFTHESVTCCHHLIKIVKTTVDREEKLQNLSQISNVVTVSCDTSISRNIRVVYVMVEDIICETEDNNNIEAEDKN